MAFPRRNPKFGPPPRSGRPNPQVRPPTRPRPAAAKPPAAPERGETHWEAVADWYDALVGEGGSEYHRHVVIPGVLGLLDATEDKRVLDVACGQGVLCRALAKRGAMVAGLDAAPGLIDAAKAHDARETLGIDYHVADAKDLEAFVERSQWRGRFDAVSCTLAIQNIAVLSPVWRGCRAALREGGRLIVVMMHPCFRVPKSSAWGWQPRPGTPGGGVQYRRVEAYLSSSKASIQMRPGAAPQLQTVTFHRPLQAYVNTLAEAGLLVDHLDEWPSHKKSDPTDPKAPEQDRAREEIPMFLALRARAV